MPPAIRHAINAHVARAEGVDATQFFVTLTPSGQSMSTAEAAQALYGELLGLLCEHGIEVFQEKVYGTWEARADVLALRDRLFEAAGVEPSPVTYLDGRPPAGGSLGGLQLWGVRPRNGQTKLVTSAGNGSGLPARRWTGRDYCLTHVASIMGAHAEDPRGGCVVEQATSMFRTAGEALAAAGSSYAGAVRTWIYVARLLDWYGELNRIRYREYEELLPVYDGRERAFPASTGIQGRSGAEECLMDVLALDTTRGAPVRARPILATARQDRPTAYGSAFSRAMTLEFDGCRLVLVSGTASIDRSGRTLHDGHREQQCLETLLNLAAVIEEAGGSLADVCSATLFCKDSETYEAYRRVVKLLKLPAIPAVAVRADICRSDLLVEIEAIAIP